MIYIGNKYEDALGNVYEVIDVAKRDDFLYHSQKGGYKVEIKCLKGANKGIVRWMDYNFLDNCIDGENPILKEVKA